MKKHLQMLIAAPALALALALHAAEGDARFQANLGKAQTGDAKAQTYVALRYDKGADGVAKNPAGALKWFLAAASQGEASAQALAGARLQRTDPVEAAKWLILAAKGGHAGASKSLAAFEKKLSPGQLAEARRRATAFTPRPTAAAPSPQKTAAPDFFYSKRYKIHEGTGEPVTAADPADHWPVKIVAPKVFLDGGAVIATDKPPRGLKSDLRHGLLTSDFVNVSVLHYMPNFRADCVRAIITPKGDYLAGVIAGEGLTGGRGHYAPPDINYNRKDNDIIFYRSRDRGKTWERQGPLTPVVPYSLHAFIPLISKKFPGRIYCFGTEPRPDLREGRENAPIAFRHSDDDGRTWSGPTLIRPVNDPDFKAMSAMQMTETGDGVWLIGAHEAHWGGDNNIANMAGKKFSRIPTREYLLRSADYGQTWTVLPGKRPGGWFLEEYNRMDEIVPVALGEKEVLALARTPEGHLWQLRSRDDGLTWTKPAPTPINHPDAPAMFFKLSDGQTLLVLHHNTYDPSSPQFGAGVRKQLWFTVSTDKGATWSEPRFIAASIHDDSRAQISYADIIDDPRTGEFHIFLPYAWRQTLHLKFKRSELSKMPAAADLRRQAAAN